LKDNHKLLSFILLLGLGAVWGSSFIIMKKASVVFSFWQISALRLIFAGAIAIPLVYKHLHKIKKAEWSGIFIVSIIGNIIPSLLFAFASSRINSATSGILNALSPIFTLLLGMWLYDFVPKRFHFLGAFLGILGCILVLQGKDTMNVQVPNLWFYYMLPVLGSFCYGISVNTIKSKLQNLKPIISGATPFLIGGCFGLLVLPFTHTKMPLVFDTQFINALMLLAILGIVGSTISMVLFNKLVQLNSAMFASSVTFIMPVFALLWGIWDHENIRPLQVMGMLIILFAVYIIRQGDRMAK